MLESRPPLRNDATGTSATRWAATDSSMTAAQVGAGPRAASRGHRRRRLQYSPRAERRPAVLRPRAGRQLAHAVGSRRTPAGTPVVEHRGDHRRRVDRSSGPTARDDRLQLGGEDHAPAAGIKYSGLMPSGSRARMQARRSRASWTRRRTCRGTAAARRCPSAARPRARPRCPTGREAAPARLELAPELPVVVELAVVGERQAVLDQRLVGRGDRSMIDSRRCAEVDRVLGRRTSSRTPRASGPRWAMRSIIVSTSDLARPAAGRSPRLRTCSALRPVGWASRTAGGRPRRRRRRRQAPGQSRRRPRGRRRLVAPGQLLLDALAAELAHRSRAAPGRRAGRRSPRRSASTSLGSTYTAASSAETRVSRRSKATTGSPNAMYSIVLFIVDTSLSGFFGSGRQPEVGGRQDLGDDARPGPGRGARRVRRPSSSRSATSSS